jgi:hypothetical protein
MRKSLGVVVVAIVLGAAGGADAKLLGFDGTLSIELGALGTLAETGACGVGCARLNGSADGDHLKTLAVTEPSVIAGPVTVPFDGFFPLVSARATLALGTGDLFTISDGGGSLAPGGDVLPVGGKVRLCVLAKCDSPIGTAIPVPLTVNGTRGVGIGGLITVNGFADSGIKISVHGAPWTVKTALIPSIPTPDGLLFATVSAKGFAHGPASETSSTAQISGVVQLVTPVRVETSFPTAPLLPAFAVLRIHLVPEPGTFLLFGAGVIALGVAARRRAKQ